jgi:hypothetical protein
MATYTLDELCDGIHDTLAAAASLVRTEKYDEISEGMQDYPTLQVYPEENTGASWETETDRITLAKSSYGRSTKEYIVHADLYAHQLGTIAEDMAQLVTTINEFEDILDMQDCPIFSLDFVQSFRWSWRRVVFEYGGVPYIGARFIITVRCGSDM